MNLSEKFDELSQKNESALILYVTAGDPSLTELPNILYELQNAGADIIEIGIPFTDPIADGPVIQAASQRALDQGVSPEKVFESVHKSELKVPAIFMGYYNTVYRIGLEQFAAKVKSVGVSGTIICDLTPEESGDWVKTSRANQIDTIFLAAPTSTLERRQAVCNQSTGFVYAVSRLGVTGTGATVGDSTEQLVGQLKEHATCPVCVGFGISTPPDVERVCKYADGAIIGSWLVNSLATGWNNSFERSEILTQVRKLKDATRR